MSKEKQGKFDTATPAEATKRIQNERQLDAYKLSVQAAKEIYELSKSFPQEERDSLTDQIRRSSRSVHAQIAKGWRRRKNVAEFVNRMNEAEGEAAETQVWLEFSVKCRYMSREDGAGLHKKYDEIIGKLINMGNHPQQWCLS